MTVFTVDTENLDTRSIAMLAAIVINQIGDLDADIAKAMFNALQISDDFDVWIENLSTTSEWHDIADIWIMKPRTDVYALNDNQKVLYRDCRLNVRAMWNGAILRINQGVLGVVEGHTKPIHGVYDDVVHIEYDRQQAWINGMRFTLDAIRDFKALPETAPDPVTEPK